MSFSLFAITERELDNNTIDAFNHKNIFIDDYSSKIKSGKVGHHYYEISNKASENNPTVSPYAAIDDIQNVLKSLHETGNFRMVTIDKDDQSKYLNNSTSLNLEENLKSFPQEKVKLEEILERYPQRIDSNRIYIVD
jgi:hypothetical protein